MNEVRSTLRWLCRRSRGKYKGILIRQLLRKYKYSPKGYEETIGLVLKQAEALADYWTQGLIFLTTFGRDGWVLITRFQETTFPLRELRLGWRGDG